MQEINVESDALLFPERGTAAVYSIIQQRFESGIYLLQGWTKNSYCIMNVWRLCMFYWILPYGWF